MDERLGIEARPPGRSGIRINRDLRVHATDLGPESAMAASTSSGAPVASCR